MKNGTGLLRAAAQRGGLRGVRGVRLLLLLLPRVCGAKVTLNASQRRDEILARIS